MVETTLPTMQQERLWGNIKVLGNQTGLFTGFEVSDIRETDTVRENAEGHYSAIE